MKITFFLILLFIKKKDFKHGPHTKAAAVVLFFYIYSPTVQSQIGTEAQFISPFSFFLLEMLSNSLNGFCYPWICYYVVHTHLDMIMETCGCCLGEDNMIAKSGCENEPIREKKSQEVAPLFLLVSSFFSFLICYSTNSSSLSAHARTPALFFFAKRIFQHKRIVAHSIAEAVLPFFSIPYVARGSTLSSSASPQTKPMANGMMEASASLIPSQFFPQYVVDWTG